MRKKKSIVIVAFVLSFLFGFLCRSYLVKQTVPEISVVAEDIKLQIPISWTMNGANIYYKERPVLMWRVLSFSEELLKEAFLYKSTEECLRHYYPNGAGFDKDGPVKKEIGDFVIYELHCLELDKYSEEEEKFVNSNDEMYLDFIIDQKKEQIYCFYFMNEMSDRNKIEEFFSKASWYEQDTNLDGRYRWEG